MFFDIAWPEFLLIGAIALVVIGPKDLPRAMRVAGYWMRKARSLSREFHNSIDQMIRESELDEVRQELKKAADINLEQEFHKTVDPDGSLAASIKPPDLPDYFDTGTTVGRDGPVIAGEAIAAEAALPSNAPEPEFVGFEMADPEPAPSHAAAAEKS